METKPKLLEPIRCFDGNAKPHEAFWNIRNATDEEEAVIELYGYISEYSWFEDDITPKMFKEDLFNAGNNGPVTIRMNSYGGDVIAASMMYAIIKDYPGKVTVIIDGIAASAATVVAMAGDVVKIQNTGYFMIHDPSVSFMFASLNIEDLTRLAGSLLAVKEGIINAYEAKTGLSRNRLSNMMTEETWMDANKALTLGFVDEIHQTEKSLLLSLPANVAVVNAIQNFEHVPPEVMEAIHQKNLSHTPVSSKPAVDDEIQRKAQALREKVNQILRKE
ncbi:MAG: Clp protease ClpP [Pelolinea sp.]|nr:Clp protease ClpP [Pelolinea sp.]